MQSAIATLSRAMAVLGGFVLSALILLTCLSILGRILNGWLHGAWAQSVAPDLADRILALGIGPVTGDFELVEGGMAFIVFAFLPLCQLQNAHASVDLVTRRLSARMRRGLAAIVEIVFAAVMIVIAWTLGLGTIGKHATGQTTFLLEWPLWWFYAASLAGAGVAAFVAVYVAVLRVAEAVTGRILLLEATADR